MEDLSGFSQVNQQHISLKPRPLSRSARDTGALGKPGQGEGCILCLELTAKTESCEQPLDQALLWSSSQSMCNWHKTANFLLPVSFLLSELSLVTGATAWKASAFKTRLTWWQVLRWQLQLGTNANLQTARLHSEASREGRAVACGEGACHNPQTLRIHSEQSQLNYIPN